ncbi:MAG: hypothetical protein C4336_06345 [Armatimonadota bacterium]
MAMQVLIAEDSTVLAKVLERALRQLGYTVQVTHNGAEAWQAFQHQPTPLVITDWEMPQMDGLELCQKIRAHPHETYTYIILLTGRDQKEDKLAAMEAGADDFLTKPLDPAELRACLHTAQRILHAENRLREQNQQLSEMYEELQTQHESLQATQRLVEHANRRFADLFENLPIACFTFDHEGVLHEWNQAAEQLYGYTKGEVLFRSMFEKVFRGESAVRMGELMRMVLTGSVLNGIESEDYDAEGRRHYVLRGVFPLRNPAGEVVGGLVVDVTDRVEYEQQLRLMNEQLQNLAITDGLTGLKNHRAFQDFLEQEFQRAQRYRTSLSLILMDVDRFKQYNDTFGHQAGDEVLKKVAHILCFHARQSDFVVRYGGEEFVVVLPNTDLEDALRVAERFRYAIEHAQWDLRPVTGSFGVATRTDTMQTRQELIEQVDQALYQAKHTGRNRVCTLNEQNLTHAA